mgnify:CR=1 FL=1
MKWDNEEVRYPYIETDEEKAAYLASLKEEQRALQQERAKLCNWIVPGRHRKLAVSLSLIQKRIDLREREMQKT